jgi:UDP-glucose 4-epimerase
MHVLITGGAGFIGSTLSFFLIKKNINVTIIDNLSSGHLKNIPSNAKFLNGDVSNESFINSINTKFDVIFHLAAQASNEKSFSNPINDLNINTKSILLLLELAKRTKCKKIIFTSSMGVYNGTFNKDYIFSEKDILNPNTFYSINKLSCEYYLKLYKKYYNIDYTIFRLFNCYGPGQNLSNLKQGMISIYLRQFIDEKFDKVLIKGDINRFRDFIHVDDVVQILFDSIKNEQFLNETINLGTGIKTNIYTIIKLLKKYGNYKKEIIIKGNTIGDMFGSVADNKKLQQIYNNNYKFIDIDTGVLDLITKLKNYIHTIYNN